MKLALRTKPDSSKWNHKLAAQIIKVRLVTKYPHAGVVIGDTLYQSSSIGGVHSEPFKFTDNWELIDVGGDDARALELFNQENGKPYDWFSLLAFALIPARDSSRWYCYELAHYLISGKKPTGRVTPEDLIMLAVKG